MKKVLGMGNALTDILFQIENDEILNRLNLIKGGMQLIENKQSEQIKSHFTPSAATMATGGSASNTINAVSKLGVESGFIGKISNDEIGRFFSENSLENGVTPHMRISQTPSGHCTILVSPDSERTLCTFLGAASELNAGDLHPDLFKGYHFFHIEGYLVQDHTLIRTALRMAKEAGLTTSVDLASFNVVNENLEFLNEIISNYVDITFANEEEARAFTSKEPEAALDFIAGICDIAVVKVGKDGSFIKSGDEKVLVKPRLSNCIDTTGAGDLYAAGFLFGLASNYSLEACGKIGSLVSGNVVEVLGAKMTDDVWAQIESDMHDLL